MVTTFLLTTVFNESKQKIDSMTKERIISKYGENKTFVIDSISARRVFDWNFPSKTRMAPGSAAKDSDILNKKRMKYGLFQMRTFLTPIRHFILLKNLIYLVENLEPYQFQETRSS